MKAKHVIYSRLISKGNYENEKIEVCIEVEDGERLRDVFDAAKKFVDLKADAGKITSYALERANFYRWGKIRANNRMPKMRRKDFGQARL